MIKVLFVCLGNICRSPMAEAIFRHLVIKEGLDENFDIDSAGTGDWHVGEPPHQETQKLLKAKNISFEGMIGRQIQARDLEKFDYIIAMDRQNKADLEAVVQGTGSGKLLTFMEFLGNDPYYDVPDPYFTGNFEEVYSLISQGALHLLQYICKNEGLGLVEA